MTFYFVFALISAVMVVMTLVERWDKRVKVKDDDYLRVERKHLNKALNKGFDTPRGAKYGPPG